MKAIVLEELNQPLALREVGLTELKFGQVLVKVLVSGLCGSQLCDCLLYTSPSPRDQRGSRMPSSA